MTRRVTCAAPGAAGDPLDDQPEQVVVRVGVQEARAGREHRRLRGREIEELRDLPHLRGMTRDLLVDGGAVPFRDAAAMVEQHAHRDVGRGREAADDPRRQHLAEAGRRATAGRARPVAAPRPRRTASRCSRPGTDRRGASGHPAPRGRGRRRRSSGRASGCVRAGSRPERSCPDRAARRAAPAGARRARSGSKRGRAEPPATRVSRGARRPAQPGGGNRAGGAHQQRPAVDRVAAASVST